MLEEYENGMLLLGGGNTRCSTSRRSSLKFCYYMYCPGTGRIRERDTFCRGRIREVPLPEESCTDIITAYVTLP